ncbi:hypothetical protein C8R46DRAFT_1049546 [Mycena filopes]|nr:hypothetical protein C8R46DRAFT_1049546 [Mycena filopes]
MFIPKVLVSSSCQINDEELSCVHAKKVASSLKKMQYIAHKKSILHISPWRGEIIGHVGGPPAIEPTKRREVGFGNHTGLELVEVKKDLSLEYDSMAQSRVERETPAYASNCRLESNGRREWIKCTWPAAGYSSGDRRRGGPRWQIPHHESNREQYQLTVNINALKRTVRSGKDTRYIEEIGGGFIGLEYQECHGQVHLGHTCGASRQSDVHVNMLTCAGDKLTCAPKSPHKSTQVNLRGRKSIWQAQK